MYIAVNYTRKTNNVTILAVLSVCLEATTPRYRSCVLSWTDCFYCLPSGVVDSSCVNVVVSVFFFFSLDTWDRLLCEGVMGIIFTPQPFPHLFFFFLLLFCQPVNCCNAIRVESGLLFFASGIVFKGFFTLVAISVVRSLFISSCLLCKECCLTEHMYIPPHFFFFYYNYKRVHSQMLVEAPQRFIALSLLLHFRSARLANSIWWTSCMNLHVVFVYTLSGFFFFYK